MSCHLEWEASLRIQAQNLFQAASCALDDMLESVVALGAELTEGNVLVTVQAGH
jgi:hypothetical protein